MEHESTRRSLGELVRWVEGVEPPGGMAGIEVTGIAADSREVRPGYLFVAIPGTREDGRRYIPDAVERGAVAVMTAADRVQTTVPVALVPDPRRALAEVAAGWHGWPARRLTLIGITGTFGKTSLLAMLEAILLRGGRRVGIVGSDAVGVRMDGEQVDVSPLTTPDPLRLHRYLAGMVRRGLDVAVLECTSQALEQRRVHGLELALGLFTNLAALEHSEYYATFRDYVAAKSLFFRHLARGAPLLYDRDNLALARLAADSGARSIGCGHGPSAPVRIVADRLSPDGTELRIAVSEPFPGVGGIEVEPTEFSLSLKLLGRPALTNATLAAAAGLCLGTDVPTIQAALTAFPPPKRRMELIHRGAFTVLDDNAGHPDSISVAFDVAMRLRPRRLHVVFAIRGQRSVETNAADAEALAVWASRCGPGSLVVTPSADAVPAPRQVDAAEEAAFVEALDRSGVAYEYRNALRDAVRLALDRVEADDLLLLLGTKGMDRGRDFLREWLEERGDAPAAGKGAPVA